jgi:nucleotide-binding universal stress UspA family protein
MARRMRRARTISRDPGIFPAPTAAPPRDAEKRRRHPGCTTSGHPEAVMNARPAILCPIDYSDASAGALRYAAAVAEHFGTQLIVMTVEDPMLTTAIDLGSGTHWTPELSKTEVARFVCDVFGEGSATFARCEFSVAVGKPPVEILRFARERACDLIVMSSHGLTGARKLFFGSTTERVLRETTIPVLVTPPVNPGPVRIEDARRLLHRIVAPVDLSGSSPHQTQIASAIAEALGLPLVLVHVIEPLRSGLLTRLHVTGLHSNRRAIAEEGLEQLAASLPASVRTESLTVSGDPAEEAAKVVRDRQAGLVVIGLHGSPLLGPRMGSVTYRILCLTPTLVLALPPRGSEAGRAAEAAPPTTAIDAAVPAGSGAVS